MQYTYYLVRHSFEHGKVKYMKLSKPFLIRHSILLMLMLISSINQATAGQLFGDPTKEEIAKSLQKVTDTVNKTLPKMIDSSTRLDHMTGENNAFNYQYTMVKHSLAEINIEAFSTSMRPKLLKNLCTNSTTEFARKYNLPMVYTYFGKNGKKITTIKVAPNECKTTNNTAGIFKGALLAGMGGFGSAVLIFIGIGIIFGIKKLYFRFFRKFDEVIKEGKNAFANDIQPENNPYGNDNKDMRSAWLKGWEQSKKSREKWHKKNL